MSEQKKYATFRDLRALTDAQKKPESNNQSSGSTSTSSISSTSSTPSSTSTPSTTSTSHVEGPRRKSLSDAKKKQSTAPERDFQRVPNSVTRDVLPEGSFRGKSKQVWDYLWSVSRGAVVPTRAVKKSRGEIKSGAGLGSMVTVDAAISHLKSIGLVAVSPAVGSLGGNVYEVFTPEEARPGYTSSTSTTSSSSPTQKLVVLDQPETSTTRTTQPPFGAKGYEESKTSFKTIDDDDETHTLAGLTDALADAARVVVGGRLKISKQERERWTELGTLLAEELKLAAGKTGAVSSAPAFFTAHLRRRLGGKDAPPAASKISPGSKIVDEQQPQSNASTGGEEARGEAGAAPPAKQSRYSLEKCRSYADHLHKTGQGINNPGGFAMTIYRSGVADSFIEKFLDPPRTESQTDASSCPDCQGSGFYYPKGAGGGVTRCRHERLDNATSNATAHQRRLTAEEINEHARLIAELLSGGYSVAQAEAQFGVGLHEDDWSAIRERAEI